MRHLCRISIVLLALGAVVVPTTEAFADETDSGGWMHDNVDKLDGLLGASVDLLEKVLFADFGSGVPFIIVLLVAGGGYYSFYFGWLSIRGFRHSINIIRGRYDNPDDPGEISHFQALTSALSATVGLGNIGGVAVAVGTGGPGAVFWMMMTAVIGMSSKLASCTLAIMYRNVREDGRVSGGPMYYLQHGLAKKNLIPKKSSSLP